MGIRELLGLKPKTKGVADRYFDLKSPPVSMLYGGERGTLQNEYRQLPVVYAVVNAKARRVASVPVKFYRAGTETEVVNSPAIDLLDRPRYGWTWTQWVQAWSIMKDIRGEVLITKNRDISRGVPSSLDHRRYDEYKPIYDKGEFMGWQVGKQQYLPDEVLFDRHVNPWDDLRGLSPLEAANISNQTEWSARRFNKRFFDNDATPGGYFKAEAGLTPQQRMQLKQELIEARKGSENAHSWVLLEGDTDMQTMGVSQRDAQFIEQFSLTLHDVCAVYGVDPAIIGFEKESKYASAKEARRYLWTDVIIPAAHDIEEVINTQLLDDYGIVMYFDFSQVEALQDNLNQTVEAAKILYDMGVPFNMINARLDLGFEDVPGGDDPKPSAAPMMFDAKPSEVKEAVIGPEVREGFVKDDEARKAVNHMIWKAANDEVASLVSGLNRKLKRFFFDAKKKLEKRVKAVVKEIDPDDIDDAISFDKLARIVLEFLTDGGMIGWKQITGSMPEQPPQAVLNMVAERAGKIKDITENARAEVRRIVNEAIESGLSEPETTRILNERLDHAIDNLQSRARTIARTEVHTAHSVARYEAMKDSEPVAKRWVAAPDARGSHIDNESRGVVDWDEDYNGGIQYPLDPAGPPEEVINCRCILVPIYEGQAEAGGRTNG